MKVLILVLTSENDMYPAIREAQQKTWDSVNVPDVQTVFYSCTDKDTYMDGKILYVKAEDKYNMMHWHCKLAIDYVWDMDWDVIFRTSVSTYVCKDRLKKWVDSNYSETMYEGESPCGGMVSGTGIVMTRNIADIVRKGLTPEPHDSEDIAIAQAIEAKGIKPKQSTLKRLHYNFQEYKILVADYYRCKSEVKYSGEYGVDVKSNGLDRSYDIIAMNELQKHIYGT